MVRDSFDEHPVLACCAYTWFPLIGLIGGLVTMIPSTIIVTIPCALIAIIFLPFDFWKMYKANIMTALIGPNLKVIICIAIPLVLIAWPFVVFFGCLIGGLVFGLFAPAVFIFDEDTFFLFGGLYRTIKWACQFVSYFYKMNYKTYFDTLDKWTKAELPEAGKPFDISIFQSFVSIFVSITGFIFCGLFLGAITLSKFLFIYLRIMFIIWAFVVTDLPMAIILITPLILLTILSPLLALICLLAVLMCGFGYGLYSFMVSYTLGFTKAYVWMWNTVLLYDARTNGYAFNKDKSCCGEPVEDYIEKEKEKKEDKQANKIEPQNNNQTSEVDESGENSV